MTYYLSRAGMVMGLVGYVVWLAVAQGVWSFADPDVFYHMGMATHLLEFGLADQFSGLAPTTLGQHFVDQHFLMHALLGVFIWLMTPVVGTKVFVIVLLLLCLATFMWMLRTMQLKGWWVAVGLVAVTNPWLFRLNLIKATPLALTLLWLSIIALVKKRYWWLAMIGAVYVWTHGGFILLPLVVAAWCLTHKTIVPLLYTVGGIALALLLHPAFSDNLFFYWEQLVQIGVVNYQNSIGVGGEWYPYNPGNLLFGHGLLVAALTTVVVITVGLRRRLSATQLFFILITVGMTVLTLKSRRYVEYLAPFLAAAVVGAIRELPLHLHHNIKTLLQYLLPACVVVMAAVPVLLSSLSGVQRDLHDGQPTNYLSGASQYLATQPTGIVAPSDWDDFPALWYGAPYQQYLIGLDATFLYRANAYRYEAWKNITLGEAADPIQAVETIAADYYVVAKDHTAMYQQLITAGGQTVYQDDEAWVVTIL
ncbi:MAG: hypothetical protein ACD_41C00303G0012 [uncultured bacterium]|nr:MAG: hypothetical protein ACD_41C00303G0012 [uncultured bacterium]HBY73745.1 hypothetical protein [Candidatus Kerfeldbacteria bacterium]